MRDFMLGSLTPSQVEKLARGTEVAEKGEAGDLIVKFKSLFVKNPRPSQADLQAKADANHVIDQQLAALQKWRTTGGPDPGQVTPGDETISQEWGGQLVLVDCKDGKRVPATVGDMNALPDFYGSIEDVRQLDEKVLRATFQVIRRETFVGLQALQARLAGRAYTGKEAEFERTQKGQGTWKGAESVDVNLRSGGLLGLGDVTNIDKTDELTRGRTTGGQGAGRGASYSSALARNACHFPPESWLRWKEYHERARVAIDGATSADIDEKINEGLVLSSFGEALPPGLVRVRSPHQQGLYHGLLSDEDVRRHQCLARHGDTPDRGNVAIDRPQGGLRGAQAGEDGHRVAESGRRRVGQRRRSFRL